MTEFRKLMAFGNSSYVVSVPKAWVEKNRLKKGDVLVVDERPNELTFASKDSSERRQVREAAINASGKGIQEIKTEITALYINNFDIIMVTEVGAAAKDIKNVFHGLVGMEIVEETTTKIVAKDMLDIKEVSMSNVVRRVDIILRSMLEDSMAFSGTEAESVYERDGKSRHGLYGDYGPAVSSVQNESRWSVRVVSLGNGRRRVPRRVYSRVFGTLGLRHRHL